MLHRATATILQQQHGVATETNRTKRNLQHNANKNTNTETEKQTKKKLFSLSFNKHSTTKKQHFILY